MIKFHYIAKEDIKEHNLKWPEIPDHSYQILITGGSGSGKTNALLNLANNEPDVDEIYLHTKNPFKTKYQLLINKRENTGLNYLNDPRAFIEYSDGMYDIYKNIEEYNPNKKQKILIVFDDIVADILSNKKLNPRVTELFIRGKKVNICLVIITQSYFTVSKNVRLNSTHYFVIKIPNKRKLQQTAFNHSSDTNLEDFMNLFYLYKKSTVEPYSFLVIDTTLPSDNSLRFRKNLSETK